MSDSSLTWSSSPPAPHPMPWLVMTPATPPSQESVQSWRQSSISLTTEIIPGSQPVWKSACRGGGGDTVRTHDTLRDDNTGHDRTLSTVHPGLVSLVTIQPWPGGLLLSGDWSQHSRINTNTQHHHTNNCTQPGD